MINVAMFIPYNVFSVTLDNNDKWVSTQLETCVLSFDNDSNVSESDRRMCVYSYTGDDGFLHYKIIARGYIYRSFGVGTHGSVSYGATLNPNISEYQGAIANLLSKPPKISDPDEYEHLDEYIGALNSEDLTYNGATIYNLNDNFTANLKNIGFIIGEKPNLEKSGYFEITTESIDGNYLPGNNMDMKPPIITTDNDGTFFLRYYETEYPADTNGYPYLLFAIGDGNNIVFNNWDDVQEYIDTGIYPWGNDEDDDNNATKDTGSKDVNDSFEEMGDNTPSTTALTSQLTNWYYVTKDQLLEVLNFFWTITDDWSAVIFNQFTGLYSNLSQCMVQVKYVPQSYSNVIESGVDGANILIGKYTSDTTAVRIAKETVNIYEASIGWSDISDKMHGNFLDLPPYSTYYLYLPYVGVVPLDGHLFHKRGIRVSYKFDLPTGIATATIYEKTSGALIQEYQAQMAVDIPFALTDTLDSVKKAIDGIGNIASSAISASSKIHSLSKAQSAQSNVQNALTGGKMAIDGFKTLTNDISDSIDLKGNVTSSNALKMFQKPTVIIQTVNATYPGNYGKIVGYPCNAKKKLENVSGFTKCVDPQITFNDKSPTITEVEEIYNLLKEGVIL